MNTPATMTGSNPVFNAAERAHETVDQLSEKAAPVLQRASGAAHRTIDKAVEAAAPAAEWVTESGKRISSQSTVLADTCSQYVRAQPLAAVAGALALGYLVGKLTR